MKKPKKNKKTSQKENTVSIKEHLKIQKEAGEEATLKKEDPLEQSQKEYLYLKAEFENYRKQSLKKQQELIRYSGESFIQSLIDNVLDDLERALESKVEDQSIEDFKKGLALIHKKLLETLKNFGIETIDPIGLPFDPHYQEALSREKTSKTPEDHVSRTFKKAYKLHDKVIRPAQVFVAEKVDKDS